MTEIAYPGTSFLVSSRIEGVPQKRKVRVKCPICKKPVISNGDDFPFCSERCRRIDLGKWASGKYVISSPVQDISESLETEYSNEDE